MNIKPTLILALLGMTLTLSFSVAGQTEKYSGLSNVFSGISEGTYRVYIRPDGSTLPPFITDDITLTKNCTGGYTISNEILPGCFGKNGSFKVTVTNPTSGVGYIYTLIDASVPNPSEGILYSKNGGSSYTFTGLSRGWYRVDIQEDRIGGGVIYGDTRADLRVNGCINGGLNLINMVKANCFGFYGGFTVEVQQPTAGMSVSLYS